LPGNVTITSIVFGEVPIINMGETGGTGWEPGVVTGVAYNLATNLIANTFVFVTHTPTGEQTFTETANLNMSLDGAYADEILDRIIAYIAGTEYTRTGNVLLATTTQDGFYSSPEGNIDSVASITFKYYVSNVITGTVTVCIDVSVYTSPFDEESTSEVFAGLFGSEYDTLEPGCATVVGSKIYVTLTAAQLAKITLLGIEYKDKYYSAGVPFTITIKDNDAFNSHPTPCSLFELDYENPSGGNGWMWEFQFVDTPTEGYITIGETAEQTALNIVDFINTYGTTLGVTATYVGNGIVSVVSGTDDISTYCGYLAREESLAVFEFSESSRSASQDPMAVMSSIIVLPLIAMQSVFDDPSVVDGEYEEPTSPGVTEIFSTETITVDDNSVIADGDTLTINIGTYPIIYMFKNLPTGAKNEILIGGTADITAANIATALNATDGAIFVATSLTSVVSITDYTSETVTKTTTSAGLTISEITPIGSYGTPGSLPAFTGEGFCGDGTGFLPAFTGAGTCTQDDFCIGRGVLPVFTSSARSFLGGCTDTSTDAEKIALLLYQNGYMQWFAQMVAITGDVDAAVLMAVQFVANYITYTTDLLLYGVTDYWTDPLWTLYKGSGDCEDGSILLTSILINLDCPVTSIKVAIGTYNSIGHSWVLYKRESDGLNVLLDWTKGSAYWNTISSLDELPVAYTEE
jgi:predicted transglutaminase-like cysteine proteinase